MSSDDEYPPRTHYHFSISLRVRHPLIAPEQITEVFGFAPKRSWKAGEPRTTKIGTPLEGANRETYWTAKIVAGRWPADLNGTIHYTLQRLACHRSFLHKIRSEGGTVELFIGWFFENQSGDVLTHQCLALAGDLQIDLSFDVYPPELPQNECAIVNPLT